MTSLIYDLGMHHGEDTAYYLKRGFRVVGVEADPEHAAFCRDRFAQAIADGQLLVLEGAIAETNASYISFYKNLENSVWGTIEPQWVARNERRATHHRVIRVPVLSFNDILETYGIPYYLKIDLEGADRVALAALASCNQVPSYISLESEMVSFAQLEQEFALLEALGYTAFRAVQQADLPWRTRRLKLTTGIPHAFEYGSSGPLPEEYPALWQDASQIRRTYRKIFCQYRLCGNDSWLWRFRSGRALIRQLGKFVHGEVPGWYDTHARHSTVHA